MAPSSSVGRVPHKAGGPPIAGASRLHRVQYCKGMSWGASQLWGTPQADLSRGTTAASSGHTAGRPFKGDEQTPACGRRPPPSPSRAHATAALWVQLQRHWSYPVAGLCALLEAWRESGGSSGTLRVTIGLPTESYTRTQVSTTQGEACPGCSVPGATLLVSTCGERSRSCNQVARLQTRLPIVPPGRATS